MKINAITPGVKINFIVNSLLLFLISEKIKSIMPAIEKAMEIYNPIERLENNPLIYSIVIITKRKIGNPSSKFFLNKIENKEAPAKKIKAIKNKDIVTSKRSLINKN